MIITTIGNELSITWKYLAAKTLTLVFRITKIKGRTNEEIHGYTKYLF